MDGVTCTITDISIYAGLTVFVVTHPIVGLAAQPILLIKLAVHSCALNYHWRHSKDENGKALNNEGSESNYLNKDKKFKVTDLSRLEHEKERLHELDNINKTLNYMKGFGKCIIPVFGLIWAVKTELRGKGSIGLVCDNCANHSSHWSPEEAINYHIGVVQELKGKKVVDLTKE